MPHRLGAALLVALGALSACSATRATELEPRYVAVHNTLATLGHVQIGPIHQGSLAEGREARLALELPAQCTTLVALGGPGVRDLDLVLLDPDDKPLARDTTRGAEAAVRACPESAGRHTLVVRMGAGAGDFLAATWTGAPPPAPAAAAPPAIATGAGTCESPVPLVPGTVVATTRRGDAEHAGSCASSESREVVYRLDVARRQRVLLEVDPQFDSVLYVRKDECSDADAEVACNDDAGGRGSGRGSKLDEVLEPGTYYVFVDGYGSEAGSFRLSAQLADVPTLADACRRAPVLDTGRTTGSLAGGFDHAQAACGQGAHGPDAIHKLEVAARSRVRITERASGFSPVVHLRRECGDAQAEVGCSEDGVAQGEAAFVGVLERGAYAVFADSSDKDAAGPYTLEVERAPEAGRGVQGDACGDAVPIQGTSARIEGDTFHARDDLGGRCGGQGAPDVVYRFELSRRSRVSARMASEEGEHVFVLLRSCADAASEIACARTLDDVLAPGVYYLAVDGQRAGAFGKYAFDFRVRDVTAREAACRSMPLLAERRPVKGTTAGQGDDFATSCGGRPEAQASADRVFKLVLSAKARVRLTLTTPTWDGVLALRPSCLDPPNLQSVRAAELACNNDFQDTRHARIETTLEAGTYYVVVDGHQKGNEGPFTLEYEVLR